MARKRKGKDYLAYYGGFRHYKPIAKEWFYSDAYTALSPSARALLMELMMCDKGNNSRIVFSNLQAQKRLGLSENTVKKLFHELMDSGLLDLSMEGDWSKGRAREWRITFWETGCGKRPTHDWKHFKKTKRTIKN